MDNVNKGLEILDFAYEKCLKGVPLVSKPVEELTRDYTKKHGYSEKAINMMIRNQVNKNTVNGFVTGFGGFALMPVTLPANFTSVAYVQMRMVASIAIIRGYDLNDDEVQTFVYACIVGKSASDVLKTAGIKFADKMAQTAAKKIPGKVLIEINKKLGFRFITKAGSKGIINVGKALPVVGAGVGSVFDFASTKIIANRAKRFFCTGGTIDMSVLD